VATAPNIRLTSKERTEVEDEVLFGLSDVEAEGVQEAATLGADETCPFELEVAAPRAVDVAKLYKLWKRRIPETLEAALGPHFAVMLCQSLTPFYRHGRSQIGVASLGYRIWIEPGGCRTASLFPESKLIKVGTLDTKVQLGLNAGGELALPDSGLQLANAAIPGLALNGINIDATTDAQFGIAIRCNISLVQVQAGAIGEGGAGWNIYKKGQRIDLNHPLLHTLLAPAGTKKLHAKIETWLREPTRFFGVLRGIEWRFPAVEYDISLERDAAVPKPNRVP
jgi:hypothetical protein